jgi:hypothetical protein
VDGAAAVGRELDGGGEAVGGGERGAGEGAGFGVDPPFERKRVVVGIGGAFGGEVDRGAGGGGEVEDVADGVAVEDDDGVVVGVGEGGGDAPVEAGGEVVLEMFAPAPDGGGIGSVGAAVGECDGIAAGGVVGPDGARFAVGAVEDVAAAPAAVVGGFGPAEAVADEAEDGRRVAFHDVGERWIQGAERAVVVDDVGGEPGVVDEVEVVAGGVAVEAVAGDAGPGGAPVFLFVLGAGRDDVEEIGKFAAYPRTGVVLVGDGVDAEAGNCGGEVGGGERSAEVVEGLGEGVGAAPDGDPERAWIGFFDGGDEEAGAGGGLVGTDVSEAVAGLAGGGDGGELFGGRKIGRVDEEVGLDLGVGGELAADEVFAWFLAEPGGGRGDEAFDVVFVGVDEKADEGLFVVGFVGDVGEDEDAGFVGGGSGVGAEDAGGEGEEM